jgi:predicted Zn-dependent protease
MTHYIKTLAVLFLFLTISLPLLSQTPNTGAAAGVATTMSNKPIRTSTGGASIVVTALGEKRAPLDGPAVAKLYDESRKTTTLLPIEDTSGTSFGSLAFGKYAVEVSAPGYLSARKEVEVLSLLQPVPVEVVLSRDPEAIELNPASSAMPPKAAKDANHGISDLKAGKFKDAQKHLESALKNAPSDSQVNFLLGYLYFQEQNYDEAQTYLAKAATLDPHNVQALDLMGRLQLVKRDYPAAKATLEQAVTADPENPAAHSLLAGAYLNQHDFKNALAQADLAIDKGKSTAGNAQIVRGQALAALGRSDEAIQALKTYLQSAPESASGPQVRQLLATLEGSTASSSTAEPAKK